MLGELIRLHPDVPQAWRWWPVLEARVTKFCLTDATDTRPEAMVPWLRKLFVETPALLGAWLAIRDEQCIGHLVGWADTYFGTPLLFVHQAKVDDGTAMHELVFPMFAELKKWADECNAAYAQAGSPHRIRTIRFATERNVGAWARYLERLGGKVVKERAVMSWHVGDS